MCGLVPIIHGREIECADSSPPPRLCNKLKLAVPLSLLTFLYYQYEGDAHWRVSSPTTRVVAHRSAVVLIWCPQTGVGFRVRDLLCFSHAEQYLVIGSAPQPPEQVSIRSARGERDLRVCCACGLHFDFAHLSWWGCKVAVFSGFGPFRWTCAKGPV